MDEKKQRKYAAELARKVYTRKITFRQMMDEFPHDTSDPDIKNLLDLVGRTPKKGGLFGVRQEKYQKYIVTVYELIEKLEG